MSSDIQDLVRKGAVSLLLRVIGGLAGFGLTLVTTLALGKDQSGIFFLALSTITILATISRLGFDQTLTRFIGRYSATGDLKNINSIYRSVIPLVFFTSLSVSGLVYLSSDLVANRLFHKPALGSVLHWMAWANCSMAVYWIHAHCFQGLHDMVRFQWFQNLGMACLFLAGFFATKSLGGFKEIDLNLFTKIYCITSVLNMALAVANWTMKPWFAWNGLESRLPELMIVATPLLGVSLMGQLIIWLPQLILGAMRDATEVSIYNAAYRTAQLTSLVLMATNSVALPRLAALYHQNDLVRLRKVMVVSTRLMVLLCIPFLSLLVIFPSTVMNLFGKGFSDGGTVLCILAIGQFINVATGSVGGLLNMTGHQRMALKGNFLALSMTTVLSGILIPYYGMVGAGIAQAFSLSSQMLYFTWAVRKQFGFFPLTLRT